MEEEIIVLEELILQWVLLNLKISIQVINLFNLGATPRNDMFGDYASSSHSGILFF